MRKKSEVDNNSIRRKSRPALTPEGRENQMIALAIDRAEEQLRNGTASSQVITHYLKLAASREKERLEREILEEQKKLIKAKTKTLESGERDREMYLKAIKAMQLYSGNGDENLD